MIYLDYNATTPVNPEVLDTFTRANEKFWANASSLHRPGMLADQVLIKSAEQVLDLVCATQHQVLFTGSATESSNLAIKGSAKQYEKGHIITTNIEHPATLEVCQYLETEGYLVTYLDASLELEAFIEALEKAITKDTFLVTCMHVNNETGLILPVKEIGQILSQYPKVKFHVDAVQSIGKLPLSMDQFGIDFLSISAHKIYGIKGVGALVTPQYQVLTPDILGGGQMGGMRSGTVNVPGAASLAKAMRLVCEKRENSWKHVSMLAQRLVAGLRELPHVHLNQRGIEHSPYVINFYVEGILGETLVHALGEHEIYISAKSACASKAKAPSHVLLALGYDVTRATESVRVSLSSLTTLEEVETFLEKLGQVIEDLARP